MQPSLLFVLSLASAVHSFYIPSDSIPQIKKSSIQKLPTSFRRYQDRSAPAHHLFRRQDSFPAVGSVEWSTKYPVLLPEETGISQIWLDALDSAVSQGLIPDVPLAEYKDGKSLYDDLDPAIPEVCSSIAGCKAEDDIWEAPPNTVGITIEGGPVGDSDSSSRLYGLLAHGNYTVTQFMVGSNIVTHPDLFIQAYEELKDDIGIMSWTGVRPLTILTNEQIVAELGWAIQIVYDSTSGHLPAYYRPPYGAVDNRVRAIAREVFGLKVVFWNLDLHDYTSENTSDAISRALEQRGTTGLLIRSYEDSPEDVDAIAALLGVITQSDASAETVAELWSPEDPQDNPNTKEDLFIEDPSQQTTNDPEVSFPTSVREATVVATLESTLQSSSSAATSVSLGSFSFIFVLGVSCAGLVW